MIKVYISPGFCYWAIDNTIKFTCASCCDEFCSICSVHWLIKAQYSWLCYCVGRSNLLQSLTCVIVKWSPMLFLLTVAHMTQNVLLLWCQQQQHILCQWPPLKLKFCSSTRVPLTPLSICHHTDHRKRERRPLTSDILQKKKTSALTAYVVFFNMNIFIII